MSHPGVRLRSRRVSTALSVVALGAVACPSLASAASEHLTLQNREKFRGYTTTVVAQKLSSGPVGLWVFLHKTGQNHTFTFDAPRSALTLNSSLTAGKIEVKSVAARAPRGLAAAALGAYGGGTIAFGSAGSLRSRTCSNGGSEKSRDVERTSGKLTFSPTKKAAARYSRSAWKGYAREVTNAAGYCDSGGIPTQRAGIRSISARVRRSRTRHPSRLGACQAPRKQMSPSSSLAEARRSLRQNSPITRGARESQRAGSAFRIKRRSPRRR